MSPIDGERRLNSAMAREAGLRERVANLMRPRENATSSSSRAAAAPESIASRARSIPSRRFSAWPAAAIPPAALRMTAERWPPSAPASTSRSACACRRVAAAQLGRVAALDAEVERIELVLAHAAVLDLADEVRPARRELVDAARAVDDVGALGAELHERRRERPRQLRRVDAEHERARAGRVRQRAEHVEHGARRELAADGRGVPIAG